MIAVINYGAGNIASVCNVLDELNCGYIVTADKKEIRECSKIILPGVGEASYAMQKLNCSGLSEELRNTKKPLLGICLGMQLLCRNLKEGDTWGLNILPVDTEIFNASNQKVPHMGWNNVKIEANSFLFKDIKDNSFFFFANSYYLPVSRYTTGVTGYGISFSASVQINNYYGVQFHPEKSGVSGIQLIKNFIELC